MTWTLLSRVALSLMSFELVALNGIKLSFRTPATIQSAKAKGGGQEGETAYPYWRRISKSIDRYHFLLVRNRNLLCFETLTDQ